MCTVPDPSIRAEDRAVFEVERRRDFPVAQRPGTAGRFDTAAARRVRHQQLNLRCGLNLRQCKPIGEALALSSQGSWHAEERGNDGEQTETPAATHVASISGTCREVQAELPEISLGGNRRVIA